MLYARNPEIIFNQVDGDLVLLDIQRGKYFAINQVGCSIWNMISNPTNIDDLVTRLLLEYDVPAEICRKETATFLQQAGQLGFINMTDE